ncbi:MAG: FkbM family methyltransferase, partial [Candidatus Paceibacteria bacterium]
ISNVKNRRAKFADVGANIGFYSILFSCLSDPNNQIDSFEPVPNNLSKLMRNKEINFCDNITVHAAAVGDKYSQVVIHVPDGKEAESTMASESWSDISISRSFNISQYDLDSFYSDKTPPDLYHIDAEGAEVRIIKGMRDIIQKQPEIYLVLHPKLVFEMGNSPSELVDIFTCAGYDSIFDLETKEALPISHLETMNSETPARYYYLE